MKKRLAAVTGIIILVVTFAAVAFADSPIKLILNGRLVQSDPAPQLINGRTMVPLRVVSEALGATVQWEEQTNSVLINSPEMSSLQRRIELMQDALSPAAPEKAAEEWAKGVKERNGALQYALLSPELKEQRRSDYESCGWVTGTSSPWVERYEITKETENIDGAWEFRIRFALATSTGPAGSSVSRVIVRQYDQAYYISQILDDQNVTEQLKTQIKDYLTRKYGRHYKILNTEISTITESVNESNAEAVFLTKVTHVLGGNTPAEWPPQRGRIKFLEENRANLSPDQIKLLQEKIDFWHKELQEYIDKPGEANEFLKIKADLGSGGAIEKDSVKLFYEDPMGNYLPVREEEWPAFKTAEELEKEGYEEMRQLVN